MNWDDRIYALNRVDEIERLIALEETPVLFNVLTGEIVDPNGNIEDIGDGWHRVNVEARTTGILDVVAETRAALAAVDKPSEHGIRHITKGDVRDELGIDKGDTL